MHAAYTWAIADALDAAGIEIPFPQTDLRLRSVFGREGDDALKVLGLGEPMHKAPAEPPPSKGDRSAEPEPRAPPVNDAALDLMSPPTDPTNEAREADQS